MLKTLISGLSNEFLIGFVNFGALLDTFLPPLRSVSMLVQESRSHITYFSIIFN